MTLLKCEIFEWHCIHTFRTLTLPFDSCFFRKHILWPDSLTRFHQSANSLNITCSRGRKWRCSFLNSSIRSVSDAAVCQAQRNSVQTLQNYRFNRFGPVFSGVGAMTWSPLACGIISGKYDSGVPAYSRASLKVLHIP